MPLQDLFEALAGAEEDAVEMKTVEPEIGAEPLFRLLSDIVAEQKLAVAVGRELADQAPHGLSLLVEQHRGKLAPRRMNRLRQLLLVRVGPPPAGAKATGPSAP